MTEHKSLAAALAAFQGECPTLPKDATNPHYKSRFTPLDTMVETVAPLLAKHGLAWSAFPCFGPDGSPALRYVLRHACGEVESEVMPLLVTKADPQGMGSAITYARRYSLAAVLNLVADEDDDGNAGSRRHENGHTQAPRTSAPKRLDAEQRRRVLSAIADADQNESLVLAAAGLSSADEMTAEHAQKIRGLLDKVLA